MEQEQEATLNKFKFPIDKQGEESELSLRQEVALKLLQRLSYQELRGANSMTKARVLKTVFEWADAFLAHSADSTSKESCHSPY